MDQGITKNTMSVTNAGCILIFPGKEFNEQSPTTYNIVPSASHDLNISILDAILPETKLSQEFM